MLFHPRLIGGEGNHFVIKKFQSCFIGGQHDSSHYISG
nr:MAG TPA: hypothetical protein [Caudoviricetes sp.]